MTHKSKYNIILSFSLLLYSFNLVPLDYKQVGIWENNLSMAELFVDADIDMSQVPLADVMLGLNDGSEYYYTKDSIKNGSHRHYLVKRTTWNEGFLQSGGHEYYARGVFLFDDYVCAIFGWRFYTYDRNTLELISKWDIPTNYGGLPLYSNFSCGIWNTGEDNTVLGVYSESGNSKKKDYSQLYLINVITGKVVSIFTLQDYGRVLSVANGPIYGVTVVEYRESQNKAERIYYIYNRRLYEAIIKGCRKTSGINIYTLETPLGIYYYCSNRNVPTGYVVNRNSALSNVFDGLNKEDYRLAISSDYKHAAISRNEYVRCYEIKEYPVLLWDIPFSDQVEKISIGKDNTTYVLLEGGDIFSVKNKGDTIIKTLLLNIR